MTESVHTICITLHTFKYNDRVVWLMHNKVQLKSQEGCVAYTRYDDIKSFKSSVALTKLLTKLLILDQHKKSALKSDDEK